MWLGTHHYGEAGKLHVLIMKHNLLMGIPYLLAMEWKLESHGESHGMSSWNVVREYLMECLQSVTESRHM